MKKARKISGMNGIQNERVPFTHTQIQQALFHIQDTLERSLIPFILLDGIAKQIREEAPLAVDEITIGVLKRHWTRSGSSIFRALEPKAEYDGDAIFLDWGGVPIVLWLINRNYKFFQNPDTRFYYVSEFRIPNPFASYWKARFIVK